MCTNALSTVPSSAQRCRPSTPSSIRSTSISVAPQPPFIAAAQRANTTVPQAPTQTFMSMCSVVSRYKHTYLYRAQVSIGNGWCALRSEASHHVCTCSEFEDAGESVTLRPAAEVFSI